MIESSDEELVEIGINLREFSRKRQLRLGSTRPIASCKKEEKMTFEVPEELCYMNLLNSAVEILKNDGDSENVNRIKLPLEVKREGRKTSVNITEMANILKREAEHMLKYVSTELGTQGSINKDGKLLLKGIFIRSQMQDVLRRYIEHFVVCKVCNNVDGTEIVKEKKLFFLKCYKCEGFRCVGNVVDGLVSKGQVKPQLRGLI